MNEIMLVMKTLESENEDFRDQALRHKWNNRFIYKPIDYKYQLMYLLKSLKEDLK